MKKTKILIADDHAIVRYGLASLIGAQADMEIVAQARNGEEAVQLALETKPDIVVMDLMMPKMDGAAATARLHDELPSAKVVILTSFGTSDGIAHAVDAGAAGALMKTTEDSDLIPMLRRVAAGERVLSPEIRRQLKSNPPVPQLTPRQQDILASLVRGLTNQDIAVQLGIRKDSVEKHVSALMEKIGAGNRTEAVSIALRRHLLRL